MRFFWTLTLSLALITPALAMLPLANPVPHPEIDPGLAASYVGRWSLTVPTHDAGERDTVYAVCDLPVRIEEADTTYIFYLGPREVEAQAAMELQPPKGGAVWAPIAGGPSFFAVFIDKNVFYLYDFVPQTDDEWGQPFVYKRCP